jgi:chaperonin GroES
MIKQLLSDNILVEVDSKEQETASGLFLPESSSDKNIQTGVVAFVGIGKTNDKGEIKPMQVKAGDKIMFEKSYNSQEIKIDDKYYTKISEADVVAIIE